MSQNGISHLLPIKGGDRYIKNALNNIENNLSYGDEILIIDDGISTAVRKTIESFAHKHENVFCIRNKNGGLVNALNLGLKASSHLWIARYDVDDLYSEQRIEVQKKYIRPNVSAIFSDYEFIMPNDSYGGFVPSSITHFASALSLLYSQQTPHPVVLMSKERVEDCGGYRLQDFPLEDLSLWLRLAKNGEIISVPKLLLKYRLSAGSTIMTHRTNLKQQKSRLIRDIGVGPFSDQYVEVATIRTLKEYLETENSGLRTLLFLRNYQLAAKKQIINLPNSISFKDFIFYLEISDVPQIINALRFKIKRSWHRSLI